MPRSPGGEIAQEFLLQRNRELGATPRLNTMFFLLCELIICEINDSSPHPILSCRVGGAPSFQSSENLPSRGARMADDLCFYLYQQAGFKYLIYKP